MKKIVKILWRSALILGALLIITLGLLNTSPVQTYIVKKTVAYFNDVLGTKVAIENVNIKFFNSLSFTDFVLLDQQQDTLLYTQSLEVTTSQWFLLSSNSTIKNIKLNEAVFKMQRPKNSPVWNYDFILEKLGLNQPSSTPKKDTKLPNIDLNYVSVINSKFLYKDAWIGIDYEGSVHDLYVDAQKVDLDKGVIDINTIAAKNALFGMTDYNGGRPDSLRRKGPRKFSSDTPFNPNNWAITVNKLQLSDSRFFLEMPDRPINVHLFDERHMDINDIQVNVQKIKIDGDTITGNILHLKGNDRCGLGIKEMRAKVKVSPKISECRDLYLATHNSVVKDYYAMEYENFPAFLDYIEKVKMTGRFKESQVSFKDIAYFTDQIDFLTYLNVNLTGEAVGAIPHLITKNIILKGDNTVFAGDVSLKGLPNVDEFYIESPSFLLNTNGKDLIKHLHLEKYTSVHPENLTHINAIGSFKGLVNNFKTEAKMQTNLGGLNAQVHVLNATKDDIKISTEFETLRLNIGSIIAQPDLQWITAKGNATYDFMTAATTFDIRANELNYKQYNYHNLASKGNYSQQQLQIGLQVDDINLKTDINGLLDFSREPYHYKLNGNIGELNTKTINWTSHNLSAKGEINVDVKGKNLDDVLGNIIVYNINMNLDSVPLAFDQLYVNKSKDASNQDMLTVVSNGVQVKAQGNYKITQLPQNIQYVLHQFVPNLYHAPKSYDPNFNINFEVTQSPKSALYQIINQPLHLAGGGKVQGQIDLKENIFNIKGAIPSFQYSDLNLSDIDIDAQIDNQTFIAKVNGKELYWNNYLIGHSIQLDNTLSNNTAVINIKTADDNGQNPSMINTHILFEEDTTKITFTNSNFYLNNKLWNIDAQSPIIYAKKYINVNDFKFNNKEQEVALSSNKNGKDIQAKLTNISLEPVNYLFEDYGYEGNVAGEIEIENIFDQPNVNYDLALSELKTNGIAMGEAVINGAYSINKKKLTLYPNTTLVYNKAYVNAAGEYWIDQDSVRMSFLCEQIPLVWMQPYVKDYVHNISGVVNGFMTLNSNKGKLKAAGKLHTKNAKLTVDIIGTTYTLDQFKINIDEDKFTVEEGVILDHENNKAYLSGTVPHHQFSLLGFDLKVQSDRIQAMSLPTNYNAYFYGNITAQVDARLTGIYDNLNFHIVGKPLDKSKLFIPIQSGSEVGNYNYISFKKPVTQTVEKHIVRNPSSSNIKYLLRIDALMNNNLESNLILDPKTNDQLQAKGEGNLSLIVPSDGDMRLNGTYTISEGYYNFAFQQLEVFNYKRKFNIHNGSTIKWNGDLYDADLNVDAHTDVKARLYDLISNEKDRLSLSNQELADAQMQQIFNVNMKMQGRLSDPRLTFNIKGTENRSVGTYAYQKLQRINNDERELLNQVTGLLLLNQFIPPEGFNSSASLSAGAITNMSEMLATVASSQISNLANKALGVEDLYIGLSYKNYALSGYNPLNPTAYTNRNEAAVNFRKNFLNNRLTAEVGGTYDWGTVRAGNSLSDNIAGDFKVQYSLSRDGNIRLKLFRTSSYDAVFQQTIGRHGAGIMYRKSFNNLNDLFNLKKSN